MPKSLEKNIFATIIYYDGFDWPLTTFELWKYLIRTDYFIADKKPMKVKLSEVVNELQKKELSGYIESLDGFYFLKGRKHLVEKRIARDKISSEKLKKLRAIAGILRYVPFVRMVGVTGGLAMKSAKVESDWDLLIVLKYGKIWTGRTLVTLLMQLIGKRRYGKKTADRVCLNYFITDQSLNVITKDLFSANEYMFLFPLYGFDVYSRFQIKNRWILSMKPSYSSNDIMPLNTLADSFLSKNIRRLGEYFFLFDFVENFLRKIEKKRIMDNPKTHQEGSLVYAADDALVFLPNPHGPKIFENFKKKMEQLNT